MLTRILGRAPKVEPAHGEQDGAAGSKQQGTVTTSAESSNKFRLDKSAASADTSAVASQNARGPAAVSSTSVSASNTTAATVTTGAGATSVNSAVTPPLGGSSCTAGGGAGAAAVSSKAPNAAAHGSLAGPTSPGVAQQLHRTASALEIVSEILQLDLVHDAEFCIPIVCASCFDPGKACTITSIADGSGKQEVAKSGLRGKYKDVTFVSENISDIEAEELSTALFRDRASTKCVLLVGFILDGIEKKNDQVLFTRLLRAFDCSACVPPIMLLVPFFEDGFPQLASSASVHHPTLEKRLLDKHVRDFNGRDAGGMSSTIAQREAERRLLDKSKLFAQYGADDVFFWNVRGGTGGRSGSSSGFNTTSSSNKAAAAWNLITEDPQAYAAELRHQGALLEADIECSLAWIAQNLEIMHKQMSVSQAMDAMFAAYVAQKEAQISDLLWNYIPQKILASFPAHVPELIDTDSSVGNLKFVGKLGEGMMLSKVYKAVRNPAITDPVQDILKDWDVKTKGERPKYVAVKKIPKWKFETGLELETLFRECRILIKSLNHPYIVEIFKVTLSVNHMYIVLEYAGKNSLFDFLVHEQHRTGGPIDGRLAQRLFRQIVSAVMHCHSICVCHRDLKPENFIMAPPTVVDAKRSWISDTLKIADFGLAVTVKPGQKLHAQCGSMPFAAPEIIAKKPYDGFKADVWSCGVCLLEMLCGVNKMQRIFGWPQDGDLSATPDRAEEIEAGFRNKSDLRATVLADIRPDYVRAFPEETKNVLALITNKLLPVNEKDRASMSDIGLAKWVDVDSQEQSHGMFESQEKKNEPRTPVTPGSDLRKKDPQGGGQW
eukprot:g6778.t1